MRMDHELRLESLREEQPNPEEPLLPKKFESFRKQLAHLREMAKDADTKAQLIAKVVQKIAVFENGVEIFFHAGRTHFSPELADTKSPASFLSQFGQSKSPKNKTPTEKSARVKISAAHSTYNDSLVVVMESGIGFTKLLQLPNITLQLGRRRRGDGASVFVLRPQSFQKPILPGY